MVTLDIGSGTLISHTARGDVNLDLTLHPVNKPQNFFAGDTNKLPFQNESFESITFLEVIEHVKNPSRCLNEIWRVLKPNGLIEVSTPNPTNWRILLRLFLHKKCKPWREHISCWGLAELTNLLRTVGFEVVKHDYIVDSERNKFEKWTHRYIEAFMHKISLCHALTGRSLYVVAKKTVRILET